MKSRKSNKDPEVIGFRFRDLEQRAEFLRRAKAEGVSPGDLARTYVIQVLETAEDQADLHAQLDQLHREVLATRNDLAMSTTAILQHGGNTDEKVAHEWVKKRLNLPV